MNKYSLMIGRYQPLHKGHITLIRKVLSEGKRVLIALRDTGVNDKNPYTIKERQKMFQKEFNEEMRREDIRVIAIPDIEEVCFGRKVGWGIREIRLDKDIEKISATEIRKDSLKSTLGIWKELQEKNYFKRLCSKGKRPLKPVTIDDNDIENKTVVEIGCGYGRETVYITKLARKVYGIEVSNKIIKEAYQFIEKYGNIEKMSFSLAEEYKDKIPEDIDYVYSRVVFQHITPEQTKDYIDTFYNKLKIGGKINIQFRIGNRKSYDPNPEPHISYSKSEIRKFFDKFKIVKELPQIQGKHLHIIAIKEK